MRDSKRRHTLIVIFFLLSNLFLPILHAADTPDALVTTLSDPIYVYTAADLNDVRTNLAGNYIQMAHINLGGSPWSDGAGWEPIGTEANPFTGSYNGNNFSIQNLTINRSGSNLIGLFGYTVSANGMQLLNIRLTNASVTGKWVVGGLVGYAIGPIDACSVTGTIVGSNQVGGIAGSSDAAIRNCTAEVSVRSSDGGGGIAGTHRLSTINGCSASGSVLTNYYGGGIVGESRGNLVNCHSSVSVTGLRDLGGIAGRASIPDSYVDGCSASGTIESGVDSDYDSFTGGLIGLAMNRVMNSYATGEVYGKLSVGGLIGKLEEGLVANCRATGLVTAQQNGGGLIGLLYASDIENSYATGNVTGSSYLGGLAGRQDPGFSGTSTIFNGSAFGSVTASSGFSGGLVGRSFGTKDTSKIINSQAWGAASGTNYVGGLIGFTDGLARNCQAKGAVHGANAGGLAGVLSDFGLIQNCQAFGNVTGSLTLGGLVGDSNAPVLCSYAHGSVAASNGGTIEPSNNYAGGLIGRTRTNAPVLSSYAAGPVSGYWYIGGLVGSANGDIWNSYALGSATGHSYVGGLCGVAYGAEAILKDIFHCYSTGVVNGNPSGSSIGGLLGHKGNDVQLTNSYYDSASGQTDTGKGELRSTSQMKTGTPSVGIYTNWSTSVWHFDPENEYPWHHYNRPDRIPVERLAGANRYTTAVSVSQMGWSDCQDGSDTVILAVGTNFPDSLAGVTLAYRLDAPILLTTKDSLPASTRDEIQRLGAKRVIILGGPGAVSANVENDLSTIPGVTDVDRIAGENRYDTARLIAMQEELHYNGIYLASGLDFPDALSAAAYAAKQGRPILLNGKTTLSAQVKNLLQAKPEISLVVIVGGPGAIADSVISELNSLYPDLTVQRISGSNRYETSLALATYLWHEGGKDVFLATGSNFPDALAGGVLAAKYSSGVLLVRNTAQSVPTSIVALIKDVSISSGLILGGASAVSVELQNDLYQILEQ